MVVGCQTASFFVSQAAVVKVSSAYSVHNPEPCRLLILRLDGCCKVLRVFRMFRILKVSIQFRMLLSTLLSSMGTIMEIAALLFALMLTFSFIGMQIFDGA